MTRRASVKSALVGLVAAEVGDAAAVLYAPPRDPYTTDFVGFGAPNAADETVPAMRPRPVPQTDTWTMDVACVAFQRGTYDAEELDGRVEGLATTVVDVVRGNPTVGADDSCVMSIAVSAVDGPTSAADDIGGFSVMVVTVTVTQRIS